MCLEELDELEDPLEDDVVAEGSVHEPYMFCLGALRPPEDDDELLVLDV
jgi:hypothetical protein